MYNDNDKEKITKAKEVLSSMIYPSGSNPDYSPLHVLCCNDTCSFTWTGAEHINQVIFIFYKYTQATSYNIDLLNIYVFYDFKIQIDN